MSKRRLLPEECYDFRVEDLRVHETWGPFATMAEAKAVYRDLPVPWYRERRHTYEIRWCVNEKKTAAVIARSRPMTPSPQAREVGW